MHFLPVLDLQDYNYLERLQFRWEGLNRAALFLVFPVFPNFCKIFSQQVPSFLCVLDEARPKSFAVLGRAQLCILEKTLVISSGEMHGAVV